MTPPCRSSSSATTPARTSSAASSLQRPRRRHRTTSSSSTTPRPTAAPRRSGRDGRPCAPSNSPEPRLCGRQTTSASGPRRGELVLLLNSDTIVPPGALDSLVAPARREPGVGRRGTAAGRRQPAAELSFGPMISPLGRAASEAVMSLLRARRRTRGRAGSSARPARAVRGLGQRRLPARPRADAEARRAARRAYFLYTEDVDFCAAIRARGRRVLFTPAAEITHLRGRSRATAPAAMPRGLPAQPAGVLREAPSALGAGAQALSAPEGRAPR